MNPGKTYSTVEMINELDIPYHTKLFCQIKLDNDDNITDISIELNYQYC